MYRQVLSRAFCTLLTGVLLANPTIGKKVNIPLPEHPRPDFRRTAWINLNGYWDFEFDPQNRGRQENWHEGNKAFGRQILVPFSWGAPRSTVEDEADIAWYARDVAVPESWSGQRLFLVIGACDWHTQVWVDGHFVGEHRGGYTPFEMELTGQVQSGGSHRLVIRVDDTDDDSKLYGKQGYGEAKGIWQTPYLEARGPRHIRSVRFTPDIGQDLVVVNVAVDSAVTQKSSVEVHVIRENGDTVSVEKTIRRRRSEAEVELSLPAPRWWSLDDPYLYRCVAVLRSEDVVPDTVYSYFGMREIGVVHFPGSDIPYVAINNEPVYLQMALDQAYHPEGYYTFPSDEFVRDEIIRAKRLGLNGMRVHVKIPIPRKLYWADKLGMLIMADVPNAWGSPDSLMRAETEHALRQMVARDYNHPSIFSWVLFNETWGLRTDTDSGAVYTEAAKEWVIEMVSLARSLDGTRLVEDNSANRKDHLVTDLNTWHAYLPGYQWADRLQMVVDSTYAGSPWNFADGYVQGNQPMFNSECGNVWGYQGSTGNVDWSWDYHEMINQFRRHPKVAGWLYTEHHDVINEWNGYYTYDREEKYTGLGDFVEGMTLGDLHSPVYVSTGNALCEDVPAGEMVAVPLWLSIVDDRFDGSQLQLHSELYGWDLLGRLHRWSSGSRSIGHSTWFSGEISPLVIRMPGEAGLAVLALTVTTATGTVVHRNFTTFLVSEQERADEEALALDDGLLVQRFTPDSFDEASWSLKQWEVLGGRKVNGAGAGFFEYRVGLPSGLDTSRVMGVSLVMELSSKPLLGKDREGGSETGGGSYMLGQGYHDPSQNPNAYPMTDRHVNPSAVRFIVNGVPVAWKHLPDDPADHRGVLSWHAQIRDRQLREAGTYGELYAIALPESVCERMLRAGEAIIRLEVDDSLPGGVAVYGREFGRYPVAPSLVFKMSPPEE